jgi:oligosaccharide repeat unit polymerase
MNLDWAIVVVIVLLLVNYWISRSILYPPFIFCFMWTLDLVVCRLHLIELDPIHAITLWVVSLGALVFTLGGLFSWLIPESAMRTRLVVAPKVRRTKLPKLLLIGTVLLAFPYLLHHVAQEAAKGSGATILERARNGSGDEGLTGRQQTDPIVIYFIPVTTFLAVLFLMEKRDRYFWVALTMAALANFISGGRTGFLMLIAALSCVQLVKTGRLSFTAAAKILKIPIAIFMTLYVVLIFVNGKTSDVSGGVSSIALFFVVSYIVGPLAALDHVLQHPSEYLTAPNHTFEFLFKIASSLHLMQYTPPSLFDQFLAVPFPTNVYTIYKFYFTDFGIYGCFLCIFLIGFLQSSLYRKARTGSELGLFLFALSLYSLIMVIFDDLYFVNTGFYIRAAIFCILYLNLSGMPLVFLSGRSPRFKSGLRSKTSVESSRRSDIPASYISNTSR